MFWTEIERVSCVLGVAGLTHTCIWAVQREVALLTQPRMIVSQVSQREREREKSGMLFLSSATCVSVTVGFVPPQSLTHADYVYLKAKSQYKPHLVCKQSGTQTQHIFPFVGRIF